MNARILSIFLFSFLLLGFGFSALSVTLSLSDSGIAEGDTTTLTATISGSDTGVSAELSSDGILNGYLTTSPTAVSGVSTQAVGSVTSTTSKSWVIQGVSSGTYDLLVTVSGASSSTTGSTTLTVDSPANVTLVDYSCDSDSNLSDGEIFSVSYTLNNNGGVSATILNDATYSTTNFPTVTVPALSNYYIDVGAGQTKTVSWSFVADSGSSERTGDIVIDLTGANLSETITCSDYSIVATATVNSPGGGGGSSTAKYEFIAEQDGKTQVTYYTDKQLIIRLKEQDSINIVPSVDVNVTYPDGTIKTITTTTSGTIEFTPTESGNYTFTYKSGTKTYTKTITVLAALVDNTTPDNKTPLNTKTINNTTKTNNSNNIVSDEVNNTTNPLSTGVETPLEQQGMPWWGVALIILGGVIVIIIISYLVNYHPHTNRR